MEMRARESDEKLIHKPERNATRGRDCQFVSRAHTGKGVGGAGEDERGLRIKKREGGAPV